MHLVDLELTTSTSTFLLQEGEVPFDPDMPSNCQAMDITTSLYMCPVI